MRIITTILVTVMAMSTLAITACDDGDPTSTPTSEPTPTVGASPTASTSPTVSASVTAEASPTNGASPTPGPSATAESSATPQPSPTVDQSPIPEPTTEAASLSEFLAEDPDLSMLAAAIEDLNINIDQMADAVENEQVSGSFTFFAASDDALNALNTEDRNNLLNNEEAMRAFLRHNFLDHAVYSSEYILGAQKTMQDGATFEFGMESGDEQVTDLTTGVTATVARKDQIIGDGIVQVLDTALVPTGN